MENLDLHVIKIENFCKTNNTMTEGNRGRLMICLQDFMEELDPYFAEDINEDAEAAGYESNSEFCACVGVGETENFDEAVAEVLGLWLENVSWCHRYEYQTDIIGDTGLVVLSTYGDFDKE